MLVSLEGWVDRAWRTAFLEQPRPLTSSTAWMLATSGLVEVLEEYNQKKKKGTGHVMYCNLCQFSIWLSD